eukprot:TRINITY_DN31893_c0_g1_i1.p1 TRINITY_DN31893_c0_g1~~TRINITY_DN31893_c0_g1_i1.p1  ORF type:complete len:103 (-),score=30.83 TRINITY_DN31893_c0_g1_i1:67-375(-)
MVEFQENLKKEAQGNMPTRGLGGQDHCQTFEVFIGTYMRQYLFLCYADLEMEYQRACLLYTSDAADEEDSVDLGGRRIIKKKKKENKRVMKNCEYIIRYTKS